MYKIIDRTARIAILLTAYGMVTTGTVIAGAGDIDKAETPTPVAAKSTDDNPYTGDPDAIAQGKALWRDTGCYSCHGGVGEGGVGPNLIDDEWVYKPTDKTLFKTIAKGRKGTNMVGWSKDLNDDQIWKVIAYIRSLYEGDPNKIIW